MIKINRLRASGAILFSLVLGACGSPTVPTFDEKTLFQGVNFVGVSVGNLDNATTLYGTAAALEPALDIGLAAEPAIDQLRTTPAGEVSARLLRGANAQLLFMQFDAEAARSFSPVPVQGPGIAHVCYQVNKTTRSYQKFLEGGATPIGDVDLVQLNPRNPVEYGYARDPDGIAFEVEHVDVEALELPQPPPHDYRIRHVSLATPDMNRLVRFYAKLLDQPNPRRAGRFISLSGQSLDKVSGLPDSKIQMAWFQTRNLELELIEYKSHPTSIPTTPRPLEATGYNLVVFEVLDLATARQRFLDAGGKLVVESTPFPGGNIVVGRDPDGNLVGLQASTIDHPFSSRHFAGNGT